MNWPICSCASWPSPCPTSSSRRRGEDWRLYGETRRGRYVQVAQAMDVRNQLAAQMTMRAGAPLLVFALILALLIVAVVGRALAPLRRLAQSVAGRSPDALTPLA
eukprot:gene17287-20615_t